MKASDLIKFYGYLSMKEKLKFIECLKSDNDIIIFHEPSSILFGSEISVCVNGDAIQLTIGGLI